MTMGIGSINRERGGLGVLSVAVLLSSMLLSGCGGRGTTTEGKSPPSGSSPAAASVEQRESPAPSVPVSWLEQGNSGRTGAVSAAPIRSAPKVTFRFASAPAVSAAPAFVSPMLYVPGEDGVLSAIDLQTQHTEWSFRANGPILASPAIRGDLVVFGTVTGTIYGLKRTDGTVKWSFHREGIIAGSAVLSDDQAFLPLGNGSVECVNLSDGRSVWSSSIDASRIIQTPAMSSGTLYVTSVGGTIAAVNGLDGRLLWTRHLDDGIPSGPTVSNGMIYFTTSEGDVHAAGITDGNDKWLVKFGQPFVAAPAIEGDRLFVVGLDSEVTALNAEDGGRLWSFQTGGEVQTPPSVAGDVLYAGAGDGSVYGISIDDGSDLWRVSLGQPVTSAFAVGEKQLAVASAGGLIYRIDGSSEAGKVAERIIMPDTGPYRVTVAPVPRKFLLPVAKSGLYRFSLPDQKSVPMQITVTDPDGTDLATNLSSSGGEGSLPSGLTVRLEDGKQYRVEAEPSGNQESYLLKVFHLEVRLLRAD